MRKSWRGTAGEGGPETSAAVLKPAVLTHTTAEMKVNVEEIFAPVCTVEGFAEFDEAIAQINASRYGLQAGVFTHDLRGASGARSRNSRWAAW